jgi:hypothetical protein
MTIQPNAFQKFIHRFLMLKPVSALLSKILFRADTLLLWATKGKLTVTRIVGLSVIQLTTRGAKTGKLRTMPLIGFPDGGENRIDRFVFWRGTQSWLVLQLEGKS